MINYSYTETRYRYNLCIKYLSLEIIPFKMLLMSDLHSRSIEIYQRCLRKANLKDTIVVMAGDMSVTWERGEDGDPMPLIVKMLPLAKALYFVAGNHDVVSDPLRRLKNTNGTPVYLESDVVDIGRFAMGGLSGIISNRNKNQRVKREKYYTLLDQLIDQNIQCLITHDTPLIPSISHERKGQKGITDRVLNSAIEVHFFGHCFFGSWIGSLEGTVFINVDGKLVSINREVQY